MKKADIYEKIERLINEAEDNKDKAKTKIDMENALDILISDLNYMIKYDI